ncbi:MAG TPA: OmpA family protein [Saprospiraceae bacterium]|nr:OmpA family protein [Saprospiraceae bacterium]
MQVNCKFGALIPFLALTSFLFAQTPPPGVSFKRLFMDYQTLNGGDFGAFRDYTDGLEFAYLQPITERLIIDVPIKIGMFSNREVRNTSIIGADVHINYYLRQREKMLSPYLLIGVGGVLENKDSIHVQVPVGFGLDLRIYPGAYFNWQSEVRFASTEDRNNFHHSIGFKYFFSRKEEVMIPEPIPDSDGDGVTNDIDLCPTIPGMAVFRGCPDTDNDGIQDSEDECPEFPGLVEFNGCPDTDGDRIADTEDECPLTAGVREYNGCPPPADRDKDGIADADDRCPDLAGSLNGCPDSDGDGIADLDDKCPTIKGKAEYQGCPDTDGDGLDDLTDRCPTMAGPADNGGCPPIETKDKETLEFAMRAVQFEHGSSRLKPESNRILNQVADILVKYPDYRIEINGHTDNTGTDDFNKKLSQDRAKACYDYLLARGISIRRMSYVGFGESRPVADNNSLVGRQLNRRVEFNLFPGK